MNFKDRGIILSKKNLQDNKYIVTIFTEKHGLYSAVVSKSRKKGDNILLEGNLVDFLWSARLHEHLGYAKIESVKSFGCYIINDKIKLYAFNSVVSLLKISFCERESHNNLFPDLLSFMESLKENCCIELYIRLELALLAETGHTLQLDKCAATNSANNLFYVSPKSGRAICKEAGEVFADKMLLLPQFLVSDIAIDYEQLNQAYLLTSYFIDRYILFGRAPPAPREIFYHYMMNIYKK
ncbi:MAG: DNA repair protein RecO [Rickettsiaceae bacterium]|nr:DNA repair protein RecO [Rickettsiaceae bacterium]